MKTMLKFIVLVMVGTSSPTWAAEAADPGAALAERYGLSGWGQIEEIAFTFNVKLPNGRMVSRHWVWRPIEKTFALMLSRTTLPDGAETIANGEGVFYHEAMAEDRAGTAHDEFINDTYWLLFPFQLVWSNPTVTEELVPDYPIALPDGQHVPTFAIRKLICQWPDDGGYTPGDAYDLYLGSDGLIEQWVFRRGGKDEGNAHTWEDHRQLGPIVVSLDHRNADDTFRLWFTDVKATLTDGTAVEPEPMDEHASPGGVSKP